MLDYYGIDTIPLHDDRADPILLLIVNTLSDFRILAIHRKPSSCLWAGQNMSAISCISPRDFNPIAVHIISDSWRLAVIDCKTSHGLWPNTIWVIWPLARDSNPRAYCCQLSKRDSWDNALQLQLASQAVICELWACQWLPVDTIGRAAMISSWNKNSEPLLNLDHSIQVFKLKKAR